MTFLDTVIAATTLTRGSISFLYTAALFLIALLIVFAAVFFLRFLEEFFIGEDPVEWKIIVVGVIIYGLSLSLTIFQSIPHLRYLVGVRFIGALTAVYGSWKALQVVKPE